MITLNNCPICKSKNLINPAHVSLEPKVLFEIMPGVEVDTFIINYYSTCQSCSVIFQNPRMSDRQSQKFYSESYYRNMFYGTKEKLFNFELKRALIDAEIIKTQIGAVSSHLDIGCGHGYLLVAVGADIKVGTELDLDYVNIKNIEVHPTLNEISGRSFELVTASHVLEHVSNPVSFLKKAIKFITRKGHLIIEVPSTEMKNGEKKPPLDFVHLFHFEMKALEYLCKLVGLSITYSQTTPHTLLICQKK